MTGHLLSWIIFIPVMGAVIAVAVPKRAGNLFRIIALAVSLIQCFLLVSLLRSYVPGAGFQFVERANWINLDLGFAGVLRAQYYLGLDGLSVPMVSLSVVVLLAAVISSWNVVQNRKGYFVLLMILNGAVIGSFCSLDLLLFYVFFEFMLLPMYFLVGIWGGPRREYASIKFFLYTLLGSILILVVFIALYLSTGEAGSPEKTIHSFDVTLMTDASHFGPGSILDPATIRMIGPLSARMWAFLLLLVGFGIKLPAVPLHTWLPDAHVEAPTAISVVLAALLLKIGGYGLLRVAYPVFGPEALQASWLVALTGIITIIYGAFNAMASKDLKRLIAYSSVSHMGFVLLGLSSATVEGTTGAIYQMLSHGFISSLLFILAGVLYDRTGDRQIENYSGLASQMKVYTGFVLVGFFASMGLPGFSGFIGEVMILLGAFHAPALNGLLPAWMGVVAASGLVIGAAYYLWTIQRMFFGPYSNKATGTLLPDLTPREHLLVIPLSLIIVALGVIPQPWIDIINPFAVDFVESLLKIKP